jgi:hypothetical protein
VCESVRACSPGRGRGGAGRGASRRGGEGGGGGGAGALAGGLASGILHLEWLGLGLDISLCQSWYGHGIQAGSPKACGHLAGGRPPPPPVVLAQTAGDARVAPCFYSAQHRLCSRIKRVPRAPVPGGRKATQKYLNPNSPNAGLRTPTDPPSAPASSSFEGILGAVGPPTRQEATAGNLQLPAHGQAVYSYLANSLSDMGGGGGGGPTGRNKPKIEILTVKN